jgi:hypothetical protein
MALDPNLPDRRVYVREGLLLLGFALLLVASAASVVLPELSKDPDADVVKSSADAGSAKH